VSGAPGIDASRERVAVGVAILTVSDTRTDETDSSGRFLVEAVSALGHRIHTKLILPDDKDTLVAQLRAWIANDAVDVIIATGGTGITGRDVTPDAFFDVYDKEIPGFGELFRTISLKTIGLSAIQSRATAGVASSTLLFALPGSTGACRDAWDEILVHQLDSRYRPCNFIELLPRLREA
jgi:molybdenum cofactor biosynthesis protein B